MEIVILQHEEILKKVFINPLVQNFFNKIVKISCEVLTDSTAQLRKVDMWLRTNPEKYWENFLASWPERA